MWPFEGPSVKHGCLMVMLEKAAASNTVYPLSETFIHPFSKPAVILLSVMAGLEPIQGDTSLGCEVCAGQVTNPSWGHTQTNNIMHTHTKF